MKYKEHKYLILIVFFALVLRLFYITSPLLDFHSHRQTQTASVAKNFYEISMDFFEPRFIRVDINNSAPGVEEMEFPIYQYLVAVTYKIFGFNEIFGKLWTIFFGLGILIFTYLIALKYINKTAAIFAGLLYAINPVAVYFNRTFQPDAMATFFLIMGVYFLLKWFDERANKLLIISSISLTISYLLKAPYFLIVFTIMLYGIARHGLYRRSEWKNLLYLASLNILPVIIAASWYIYSYFFIYLKTGLTIMRGRYGANVNKGWLGPFFFSQTNYWAYSWFYKELFNRILLVLTPFGAVLFGISLISFIKTKIGKISVVWFIGYLVYFIINAEYNLPHYYYQLPLVPVASISIGYLGSELINWAKRSVYGKACTPVILVVSLYVLGSVSYNTARPWYEYGQLTFEGINRVQKIVPQRSKIFVSGLPNAFSEVFYYTNTYMLYVMADNKQHELTFLSDSDGKPLARLPNVLRDYVNAGLEYYVYFKVPNNMMGQSDVDEITQNNGILTYNDDVIAVWKFVKGK